MVFQMILERVGGGVGGYSEATTRKKPVKLSTSSKISVQKTMSQPRSTQGQPVHAVRAGPDGGGRWRAGREEEEVGQAGGGSGRPTGWPQLPASSFVRKSQFLID